MAGGALDFNLQCLNIRNMRNKVGIRQAILLVFLLHHLNFSMNLCKWHCWDTEFYDRKYNHYDCILLYFCLLGDMAWQNVSICKL